MIVYALDPVRDPRWPELVDRHPYACAFHTREWLLALRRTYGYQPVAFTTSPPQTTLADGIVFCGVNSWITGRRLVSLPFSDHCEPLVNDTDALSAICAHVDEARRAGEWDYVELRPQTSRFRAVDGFARADRFWLHLLDLRPAENSLFAGFHKDSIQRKIHRADREHLVYEEASGERLLREFYGLLLITRQRHQLPPQPLTWFRNLAAAFGAAMKVRVARLGGRAVAAIVTLRHRDVMVYKYGASDADFHRVGGMHLLFWKTIQEAHSAGCTALDLGRSDLDNDGLVTFKDRWGAVRSEITSWRDPAKPSPQSALRKHAVGGIQRLLGHAPAACRVAAGRFLYRHAG